MRKFFVILLFVFISILNSAYNFPEKLPAPFDYDTYTFDKVKFGQTSVNEFAYIAPNFSKPVVEGVYSIYSENNLNNLYKSLRVGFKDNFLDWVELEFAVPQSVTKLKENYGKPLSVNTAYSNKFNYLDYGYFNFVTDKNNSIAFAVTLYGESDFNAAIATVVSKMPDYKNFNFVKEFIPGRLMEVEFNATYPNFPFSSSSDECARKTYSVPAKYLKHNNYYSSIDIVFTNGILGFINFKPKKMNIMDIKQIYGQGIEKESAKNNIFFWEYPNFVVTFDKTTNKVLNIGIIGAN